MLDFCMNLLFIPTERALRRDTYTVIAQVTVKPCISLLNCHTDQKKDMEHKKNIGECELYCTLE